MHVGTVSVVQKGSCNNNILKLCLTIFLAGAASFGYPNFIGFSYNSCVVCHFNPYGGGPLTDYGRATGAVAIAAKPVYAPFADDEKLAAQSQFLGTFMSLPEWFRPALAYRGLYLMNKVESDQAIAKWIHMQTEATLTVKTSSDKWIATGTIGYVPLPSNVRGADAAKFSTTISREHYLSYRPSKHLGFNVGKMDVAFGVHVPDHNAYIRGQIGLNQSDQSYAFQTHLAGENWESILQALAGNLSEPTTIQQRGGSVLYEHDIAESMRLGVSGLFTKSSYRTRAMGAAHGRFGFPEGSALLAEVGFDLENYNNTPSVMKQFAFVQGFARLTRGFFLLTTLEYYKANKAASFRVGPGIQYFPMSRLEIRADFQATQVVGQTPIPPDRYDLLLQVHLWL